MTVRFAYSSSFLEIQLFANSVAQFAVHSPFAFSCKSSHQALLPTSAPEPSVSGRTAKVVARENDDAIKG
tara:strand:+ start:887 stop:1096 length:210 start_codon:yes stop_codon:yes gene_type:complete